MASLAYDEVAVMVKYTLPIAKQHYPLPEESEFAHLLPWIHENHPDIELLAETLALYQFELELRKTKPIDILALSEFLTKLQVKRSSDLKELVLMATNGSDQHRIITIKTLLKDHGLPSIVPALVRIFKCYNGLIEALTAYQAGKQLAEIGSLEDFDPFWSHLVLQKLFPACQSPLPPSLPAEVKQQAQLYLDLKRPFLLYKFRAEQYDH